jgi:hypothetical protein
MLVERHIGLDADDGLDPLLAAAVVKVNDPYMTPWSVIARARISARQPACRRPICEKAVETLYFGMECGVDKGEYGQTLA